MREMARTVSVGPTTFLIAVFAVGSASVGQGPATSPPFVLPGQSIEEALFDLAEMDMHLHAGMERPVALKEWIDLAVANGRRVLVVLDHRELYDRTPEEYAAWAKKNGLPKWYPVGPEGQVAVMKDLAQVNDRRDVIAFRGWEVWEGELDEGLDRNAMALAEVIGWHISPNGPSPPCGATLTRRIRQIAEVQKELHVPMIVFHPFDMRIERIRRDAAKQGRTAGNLTGKDYRFFQPGEQEEVVSLLQGRSIYIEISHGIDRCWDDPVVRQALIEDIKPLADRGVQFTVSTDNHGLASAKRSFDPRCYCDGLGVTPRNTNTLVRELLALRAKRALSTGEKVSK
jgi:hypothetical protein